MPMTNRSQALANNRKPEKFSDEEPEIIAALLPKTTPASSTGSSSNDSTNQLGKQRLHQLRTNAKQPAGFINKVPQQPKANKFGDDEQQQQQQQQRVAGIRDKLGADTGRSRQRSTDNDDGIDGDVFDDTAGNSRQHPRIKRVSSLPGSAARVRRVSSPTFVPTGEFANQHQSTANEYQGNSRGRSALAGNRRYQCASANSSPLRNRTSVSPNPVLYQQHASDTAYVPQYPTRPISPTILLRHDDVNSVGVGGRLSPLVFYDPHRPPGGEYVPLSSSSSLSKPTAQRFVVTPVVPGLHHVATVPTTTGYLRDDVSHPLYNTSITLGSTDGRRIDVRKVLDPQQLENAYRHQGVTYGSDDLDDADDASDGFDDESRHPRQKWSSKMEFILACIGYAVGLGNVWRFPYLAYKSGGGAFMVPYLVMLLVCGVPLMYMELAVGQYTRRGPIQALERLCPFFKGAGFGTVVISFLLCTYYNVIIAWALFYLFSSFRAKLPWSHCNNTYNSIWCMDTNEDEEKFVVSDGEGDDAAADEYTYNSTQLGIESRYVNCTSVATSNWTIQTNGNDSSILKNLDENDSLRHLAYPRTPTEDFFLEGVLKISTGVDDPQAMRWELVLALFVAWILVYFSIWKSVKSSGKVVYFTALFPYVIMVVFLVSCLNLPGAKAGVMYLIRPNWDFLWDADVWINAASQIFNSIGIGFGSLIAFASYNQYHNSILKDTLTVATVNAMTSVLAGVIVFATLGNLSYEQGKCIDDIVSDGPGLVFVVYPQALNKMPLPTLWAMLFFFMLLCLGLDSQFAMVEVVITSLTDAYGAWIKKWLKKHELLVLVVCCLSFLCGLPNVTEGGIYYFQLIDHYAASVSIMYLTFFEVIAVCWFYGAGRLARNCLEMTGHLPSLYFQFCWWFASPLLIAIIWVYSLYESQSVSYNNERYKYPAWAEYFGWFIASVSIVPIPVQAVIAVCNAKGNTWKEKLRESLKSKITYCPTCGSDLLCKTGRMRIHNANADEETDSALRSNPSRKLRLKMKKLRTSKSARNAAAHSCAPDKNVGAQILGPASPKATTEDVKIQNNLEMNELNSGASQNS